MFTDKYPKSMPPYSKDLFSWIIFFILINSDLLIFFLKFIKKASFAKDWLRLVLLNLKNKKFLALERTARSFFKKELSRFFCLIKSLDKQLAV